MWYALFRHIFINYYTMYHTLCAIIDHSRGISKLRPRIEFLVHIVIVKEIQIDNR